MNGGSRIKSLFLLLGDHVKELHGKVNSVRVAAGLFFPGCLKMSSTAAKAKQIKGQFSKIGPDIFGLETLGRHSALEHR
jgi:hypothetical protein